MKKQLRFISTVPKVICEKLGLKVERADKIFTIKQEKAYV